MIIATAGHVDHGKTSLLKRLTGVDADRLPEEKRRGLTIDLGFAYSTDLRPGETTGFVDVPGHEKFIHNMLAGVTAIDAALLVVAADDGPMPQTREHLSILDLVGVRTGFVALTKTDLVDVDRRHAVVNDIAALLEGTTLAGAPIHPVSSATGDGVTSLVAAIRKIDSEISGAEGCFRMAIDRSFVVDGAGLVVT
ncbi:MAG: GTP-binding protein, partial [Rhodospirillaceae bacterium]|nr:GTP-binding protein [Rhodospirillaceae bacterium]